MYTSSFYATATGQPDPPFLTPFSPNRLPLEYAPARELCRVPLHSINREENHHSLHDVNQTSSQDSPQTQTQSETTKEHEDGCVVISDVENWLSQTIKLKLEGKASFDLEDRHVMAGEEWKE